MDGDYIAYLFMSNVLLCSHSMMSGSLSLAPGSKTQRVVEKFQSKFVAEHYLQCLRD